MGVYIDLQLLPLNDSLDTNYININENLQINAVESSLVLTGPNELYGNETYTWTFPNDSTLPTFKGSGPHTFSFYTEGTKTIRLVITQIEPSTSGLVTYTIDKEISVYALPTEIFGPDYILFNSTNVNFYSKEGAQSYIWYLNGIEVYSSTSSTNDEINIDFLELVDFVELELIATYGNQSVKSYKKIFITLGNSSATTKQKFNATPNLVFFNKEGDFLNFEYQNEIWNGELFFDKNSSHIFKTQSLYIFEKVNPISYKSDNLQTIKWQLFNEHGIDFVKKAYTDAVVDNIEVSIKEVSFYSKWIYGENFHFLFNKGDEIYFKNITLTSNSTIPNDFISDNVIETNKRQTYTIVDKKVNAILILTPTDNQTWLNNSVKYDITTKGTIHSANFIRIWNDNYLSGWNQDNYNIKGLYGLYDKKKLSVNNSVNNNNIYTVNFPNDNENYDYTSKYYRVDCFSFEDLLAGSGFQIDLTFNTRKINIPSQSIDFIAIGNYNFIVLDTPSTNNNFLLDTKVKFKIEESVHPNQSLNYTITRKDTALNILEIFESDRRGFEITINNVPAFVVDPPKIVIKIRDLKTLELKTISFNFSDNSQYLFIRTQYFNNKYSNTFSNRTRLANFIIQQLNQEVFGLTSEWISSEAAIYLNELEGFTLENVEFIFAIDSNAIGVSVENLNNNTTLPTENLSISTAGYYIYHQSNTNTIYIQIGYVNNTPTWYALPENKYIYEVSTDGILNYIENLSCSLILESNTISIAQNWENDSLLSVINTIGFPLNESVQNSVNLEYLKLFNLYISKNNNLFRNYGLDLYVEDNKLCVGTLYLLNNTNQSDVYVSVDFVELLQNNQPTTSGEYSKIINPIVDFIEIYSFEVIEELNTEFHRSIGYYKKENSISSKYIRKIVIEDIDNITGFNININGINYFTPYANVTTGENVELDTLLEIERTLQNWGNEIFTSTQDILTPDDDSDIGLKYFEQLQSQGVYITLDRSMPYLDESTSAIQPYDTIVIESQYPNVAIDFIVSGTNNNHKILDKTIIFYEIENKLVLTINQIRYEASGLSTEDIVDNWINIHEIALGNLGVLITKKTINESPSIEFSSLENSTNVTILINVGKSNVNNEIYYEVISHRNGNVGLFITGNQLIDINGNFENNGFATGMLLDISNSKWPLNNKDYNILFVDPIVLSLSYQGPFWSSSQNFPIIYNNFDWELYDFQNITFSYATTIIETNIKVNFTIESNLNIKSVCWQWGDNSTIEKYIFTDSFEIYSSSGTSGTSGFVSSISTTQVESNYIHTYLATGKYLVTLTVIDEDNNEHSYQEVITLTLDSNTSGIINVEKITLDSKEYIRYPREGYNDDNEVYYTFRWDKPLEEFFFYDFLGTQLPTEGDFAYTGVKPLFANDDNIFLKNTPNLDSTKNNIPTVQQTVFDELNHSLAKIDDENAINFVPQPLQIFLGYSSQYESVDENYMIIEKRIDLSYTISTTKINENDPNQHLDISQFNNVVWFINDLNILKIERFDNNFFDLGFKKGMYVEITGLDNTLDMAKTVFENSGLKAKIKTVNISSLVFEEIEIIDELSFKEITNPFAPYNTISISYDITIKVLPDIIGRIKLTGESENEDDRFRVMLFNNGIQIKPKDTFIFKNYDIDEAGVDWNFLNLRRKELLRLFPNIYNYIGSYKAVINAINLFGWNELEFNEYYRNIDKTSPNYGKLHKLLIPDLFNNQVEGFTVNDFILSTLPNRRYNKTNLFNLTYKITDNEGNSILAFSLNEVIIKLLGLKNWLQENTITIGKRILDITGETANTHRFNIVHDNQQMLHLHTNDTLTPVDFDVEAYLQPIVNNSETYNIHINFKTYKDVVPDYFTVIIRTYSTDDYDAENVELDVVQKINEYRTNLDSYNFVADINVDPFILIETLTDSGYGTIYKKRKTFNLNFLANNLFV